MSVTINIDDDLMYEIKKRAYSEDLSMTSVINHLLRNSIKQNTKSIPQNNYDCPEFSLGNNQFYDLNKALQIVSGLED